MAKIPPITRIAKEDFSEYDWAEKLLWPINLVFQTVLQALNKDLTLNENLSAQTKDLIITDTQLPLAFIADDVPRRVTDVWITKISRVDGTSLAATVGLQWELDNNNAVQIQAMPGLVSGEQYRVRFAVLGE